jgi:hypothetical protein
MKIWGFLSIESPEMLYFSANETQEYTEIWAMGPGDFFQDTWKPWKIEFLGSGNPGILDFWIIELWNIAFLDRRNSDLLFDIPRH